LTLRGYEQLQSIAQALQSVAPSEPETAYLRQLARQVNRALTRNQDLAQDLGAAHTWLRRIAAGLRYPPSSEPPAAPAAPPLPRGQVKREMDTLRQAFRPAFRQCPAQTALYSAWRRVWQDCGSDLLHCYDIPGLPPDNLQWEARFGRLRRHQRRLSGRKSTRELRDLGQHQVLFLAESEADLLAQLRQVPLPEYYAGRQRLAEAEAPRQFLYRRHRDPVDTMRQLVAQHTARRTALASTTYSAPP